jgi:hypothetical protein
VADQKRTVRSFNPTPSTITHNMSPSSSSSSSAAVPSNPNNLLSSWGQQMTRIFRKAFPMPGQDQDLGTIWQGQEAQDVFDQQHKDDDHHNPLLRSIQVSSNVPLRVAFRNLTPLPLLLCWVSFDGTLHHFYRLEPSTLPLTEINNNAVHLACHNDHTENTHAGHSFCLIHADSDAVLRQIQHEKKLPKAVARIVGGYRPKVLRPEEGVAATRQDKVVQLVEISHNGRQDETPKETMDCGAMLRPCFGGSKSNNLRKRKMVEEDGDNGSLFSSPLRLSPTGWSLKVHWRTFDTAPVDTSCKVYDETVIGGWPCCVEPGWSDGDAELEQLLAVDIEYATKCLPPHAREYLKQHCKIWINKTMEWGPKSSPIKGQGCCYHPDKDWLIKNGQRGDKHLCVEMNNASYYKRMRHLWGVGGVILHEMSHAYHHSMLPDGYKNCDIKECYEQAMKDGLYKSVQVHGQQGPKAKAYACSNCMEYWAELSAAFLGGLDSKEEYNKWYPFNRQQIKEHDPRAFSVLSKLWSVDAIAKRK